MRPTGRSCARRLPWLGNTIRLDMLPETPGRPRSRRLIASRQRSTARSRATAKIPLCGGQTPPGPKDRCRSARRRLRMSGVGTDLIRRRIVRSYLAQLYGRYKNWPDGIAAYNWGLSNVDTWIRAGRPREKLLAGVALYTMRVLYDSGLCYGAQTSLLRGSAIFDVGPTFRPALADPSTHSTFAHFDTDDGAFTRNQRYLCGTVPSSCSKAGLLRMKQGTGPSQSRLEQITASARRSWKIAIRRPPM